LNGSSTRFPIHVNNDTVVTIWIGLVGYNDEASKGWIGQPEIWTVPQFLIILTVILQHDNYSGASIRGITSATVSLMTPSEANRLAYRHAKRHCTTIYASVASYRDPNAPRQSKTLYNTAKYPERIRVAIIDQRAR
jgi:hypothetical protein